jgi:SRSO17 transposase
METTEGRPMDIKDIAKLGKLLAQFLTRFASCFARVEGRFLLSVYVNGLLSDVQRKNAEAIALFQDVAPRNLQRFLESIVWNEGALRDRCQQIIATEHADPEAIGSIDETGTAKSGACTAGVKRQYNGNRGKIENCVNHVAIAYSSPGFCCLLDAQLYLPKEWTDDPVRRKKTYIPDEIQFQTKPEIALQLVDRAKANGIRVMAWNADELYGRDGKFLDGLDARHEAFVVEVPPNAHVWMTKPKVLKNTLNHRRGRPQRSARLRKHDARSSAVENLAIYSPVFRETSPQKYRIKDTHRGSEVWEIRWHKCWRRTHTEQRVSKQCTLIVTRNVLTDETKYFLANRVPGRDGWSLRRLLRVAFGRWPIEDCFREAKEELGLDHYECRGWRCIHRHLYVAILSQLFCAEVRQQLSPQEDVLSGELLTMEQVRRAVNIYLESVGLPRECKERLYRKERNRQDYYQKRNAQATKSHRKTRKRRLLKLEIEVDRIKSILPKPPE